MHNSLNNLINIENQLKDFNLDNKKNKYEIIAVSKTHPIKDILPLINHGHINFGENKIQEAIEKWSDIKSDFPRLKLHMLGKVQTNKVKFLIPLFDYIHSLDNLKLAHKISQEQIKKNKKIKIFIQVNIGREEQKNGVDIENLENFYKECSLNLGLDIIGLMCLPPKSVTPSKFFFEMKKLSSQLNIADLSMGMSDDFVEAAQHGATYLRIGSKIFGDRA
jgi:pyridoxal phosphate enzyme (YggS family)